MITREKGCLGSPFSYVISCRKSFLYISNFTDIFIVVQKIISWKAGETELICLHGGSYIGYVSLCEIVVLPWEADFTPKMEQLAPYNQLVIRQCRYKK